MRWILPLFAGLALASGQERVVESVVPALAYGPACSSTVELQNLSDRPVVVDVEPHRASGALVAIAGHPEITLRLTPRERSSYKLAIEEETESAWVKVRERVPSPDLSPVVAVSGETECVVGDQLRTAGREVVYPTQSPWFSGDVTDLPGGLLSLINTSEHAVKASACYSSGGLFSMPSAARYRGPRRVLVAQYYRSSIFSIPITDEYNPLKKRLCAGIRRNAQLARVSGFEPFRLRLASCAHALSAAGSLAAGRSGLLAQTGPHFHRPRQICSSLELLHSMKVQGHPLHGGHPSRDPILLQPGRLHIDSGSIRDPASGQKQSDWQALACCVAWPSLRGLEYS